jgi:hypothetical protein
MMNLPKCHIQAKGDSAYETRIETTDSHLDNFVGDFLLIDRLTLDLVPYEERGSDRRL